MRSRFALPTAVLLCAFTAGARTPTTKIDVLVTSMQGVPIEHAEVAVRLVKGDKPRTLWRLHTHDDGIAKTPAEMQIPQGAILVEVTAAEYAPFSQTFEVHEDRKTIEVKMTSGMTKLNVHVTTQGGRPIEHADVVVKFVSGHSAILLGKAIHASWEMRTNQEGVAKVPEVPQGTILIQVIATGYQTFGQTYEVNQLEKTVDIKLNSPQEQYSAH
ncbi:MAG TPA: carboxypeptidase-like regulatory domain-containing protein [Bryobacteraceae bacterium]|jgi:5-hydroxyisourate hydrolase-like protein (transthyretin family)|nr:carboxypeptidase-like regulatory domain-containing protein [Bryobacteraceae bacterium]